MKITADFHVHSKFSRATAKNLDLENLWVAAQIKGVDVVATGDFSHPAWFAEIEAKLEPARPGLFKLKQEFATLCGARVPPACRADMCFILATEISNIYKKDGKTRKNHNLVLVPDLDTARRLNRRLAAIGNIHSDGRPILGLDARDLLEIVLETSTDAFLIPAHIWTPWFSVLGSKSGFDSIAECFGDLTPHVFAAETGLSSDPAMNWRVSSLDGVTLVSNSDAHSPANLGREANLFETELSYFAMRDALKEGDAQHFKGTIEFYPEEGKYHLDGHRSCGVCLAPRETMARDGKCPVCGKPLTIGVLYRVEELADRPAGTKPATAHPYCNLVPLTDILAEVLQVGPKTGKVSQAYQAAVAALGPELGILQHLEPDRIEQAGIPLLPEAIRRMRENRMDISPGFDGEYGRIKIFSAQERKHLLGQRSLFAVPDAAAASAISKETQGLQEDFLFAAAIANAPLPGKPSAHCNFKDLNDEQLRVVEHKGGPLLIAAGPGTGKTHTLTRRIARLILETGVPAGSILAVTFTRKAAAEMRARLSAILGDATALPFIDTFHGLCLSLLRELSPDAPPAVIDEEEQAALMLEAVVMVEADAGPIGLKPQAIQDRIMRAKQNILSPADLVTAHAADPAIHSLGAVYRAYQQLMDSQRLLDYEDLILQTVRRLETDAAFQTACRERFRHVFVDEYQDVNNGQYRIIRALVPPDAPERNLCVIGDPDQSIYGFRGSDPAYFRNFGADYPDAGLSVLSRNYRSTDAILSASFQVIRRDGAERSRTYSGIDGVKTISMLELSNEHHEAEAIARIIDGLVGGTGFHALDTGRVRDANLAHALSYTDFAVLARTHAQLRLMADVFGKAGIPFQMVSRTHTLKQAGMVALVSLLKMVAGVGGYADVDRAAPIVVPAVNRKIIATFKAWCFKNRLPLKDGLAAAVRFPVPGLSRTQQLKLTEFASSVFGLADATAPMDARGKLAYLSRQPGLAPFFETEDSTAALDRLAGMSAASGTDTVGFLAAIALHTDTDAFHPRAEKVALMSMHASKGLEFSVVFIAGCEDGLIPYRRAADERSDVEEERRLFYVAMTRARQRLYLSCAKQRRVFGKAEARAVSPFVRDIEERLRKDETPRPGRKKKKDDQLQLF